MELGHIIKTHRGYYQLVENELGHRTYISCDKPRKVVKSKIVKPKKEKLVDINLSNKIVDVSRLKVGDIVKSYYYHNGKKEGGEKIVALHNNKRVFIDLPKGAF